jgi:macrodomain Ter protein organizer (MatP/YcbG family)
VFLRRLPLGRITDRCRWRFAYKTAKHRESEIRRRLVEEGALSDEDRQFLEIRANEPGIETLSSVILLFGAAAEGLYP